MITLSGILLALSAFLLGFAWGRREPVRPVLYRAGRWTVSGEDCAYLLSVEGQPVSRFASYHKAAHAADLNNGAAR